MVARITKEKSARWQVIVPWLRDGQMSEVVVAEIVTNAKAEVGLKVIGGREITFPLERAKMLLAALGEAVASLEAEQ